MKERNEISEETAEVTEKAPLGSWKRTYALVLAMLAFWIVVFTIITKVFE